MASIEDEARKIAEEMRDRGGSPQHAKEFLDGIPEIKNVIGYNKIREIVDMVFWSDDKLLEATTRREQEMREKILTERAAAENEIRQEREQEHEKRVSDLQKERERMEKEEHEAREQARKAEERARTAAETARRTEQARASAEAHLQSQPPTRQRLAEDWSIKGSMTEPDIEHIINITNVVRDIYRRHSGYVPGENRDKIIEGVLKAFPRDDLHFINVLVDTICNVYDSARGMMKQGEYIQRAKDTLIYFHSTKSGISRETMSRVIEDIIEEVYGVNHKTREDEEIRKNLAKAASDLRKEGIDSASAVIRLTTNPEFKNTSRYLIQDIVDHMYSNPRPVNPYLGGGTTIFDTDRMYGNEIIWKREYAENKLKQEEETLKKEKEESEKREKIVEEETDALKRIAENREEHQKKMNEIWARREELQQKIRQEAGRDREGLDQREFFRNQIELANPYIIRLNLPDEFYNSLFLYWNGLEKEENIRKMVIRYQKEGRITQEDAQRILEYIKTRPSLIEASDVLKQNPRYWVQHQAVRGDIDFQPKEPDLPSNDFSREPFDEKKVVVDKKIDIDYPSDSEAVQDLADEVIPTPEEIESGEAATVDRKEFPKWVLSNTKTEDKHAIARDVKALHVAIDAYVGMSVWNMLLNRAHGKDKKDAREAVREMWTILFEIKDMMENIWKYEG